MLTIYTVPISLYCAKLRILLRHKGLDWEEQLPPGGYGSEEYKSLIVSGNLPALIDGSILVADSEAIAEYLDEKHPLPAMLPRNLGPRAKIRELSRFHDTRLEPELRILFGNISLDKRDVKLNKIQTTKINMRLTQLSSIVDGAPTELTLAYCGYPITFAWLDILAPLLSLGINWPKDIIKWREEIEAFPAVSAELSDYCPKLREWLGSLSDST
jgi:glutathione S-transferase/maleylpyruvate isomerase